MVCRGHWKYAYSPAWDQQVLFNEKEDPEELNNLAGKPGYEEMERELKDVILDWIIGTGYSPRQVV